MAFSVETMGGTSLLQLLCLVVASVSVSLVVQAEDAYKFYTWTVTYGTLSPLGTPQQVGNQLLYIGSNINIYSWIT